MVIRINLEVEVDTDETRNLVQDRFGFVDYYATLKGVLDDALDEFGEVEDIDVTIV